MKYVKRRSKLSGYKKEPKTEFLTLLPDEYVGHSYLKALEKACVSGRLNIDLPFRSLGEHLFPFAVRRVILTMPEKKKQILYNRINRRYYREKKKLGGM